MKYENKKKVDEICKKIDNLKDRHKRISDSDEICFRTNQYPQSSVDISGDETKDPFQAILDTEGIKFQVLILDAINKEVDRLKQKLKKL